MATLYTEEQLKHIVMACPNEDTQYPSPEVMVDEHGNRLYAYVTLVMLGDRYIPGAIVLAHSIRRLDSQADLVVLVTPDVSEDGRRILATFFDRVVPVDFIKVPNWRVRKQPHRRYLELVFTKFHLFNLTQYKKVLLIDADALVLKYPDHLFSLPAPMGCLLENKDLFISYDSKGNYILPGPDGIRWYKEMCQCCGHGKRIPKAYTDRALTDFKNSGIGGGLILLEPKKGELESILRDVRGGRMKYLVENKFIWPEQQYLTVRYSGQWTGMNPRFFGLQGYPHWSVLYGLQYGGDKPFVLESKADMTVRTGYPDFILWHKFYSEILEVYPHLGLPTNKVLAEVNQMHKFFVVKIHEQKRLLSRYAMNKTPEQIKQMIRRALHVERVNDQQLDSYFLNPKLCYRPYKLKAMFPDVGPYDYFKPMERLAKNFVFAGSGTGSGTGSGADGYYASVLSKRLTPGTERLDKIAPNTTLDLEDLDEIMLQYVKSRPSTFCITLWPIAFHLTERIATELARSGNVYYVRQLRLSYEGLKNLMFWMYDEFSFHERNTFIAKKLEYVRASKVTDNSFSVIIFDNVRDVPLSGQGSEFKKRIRNFALGLLNEPPGSEIRGNDIVHINDHFYQTVNYAEMLLNANSVRLLDQQRINLENMTEGERVAHLRFQTFVKFLFTNLSPLEISKIITMGGAVLYAYGVRPLNDIDSIMIQPNSQELEQLMYDTFQNEATKFEFADMGIEGRYWRDSWTEKNKQILDSFGIAGMVDLVCNPRYHMYFQGVKMYLLEHELRRKLFRHRAQDYADFVVMLLFHRNLVDKFLTIDDVSHRMVIRGAGAVGASASASASAPLDGRMIGKVLEQINKKYPPSVRRAVNFKMLETLLGGT